MGEPEQFKVVMVGENKSVRNIYQNKFFFDSNRKATIGVDFYISETHGAGVNVQVWNIARNLIDDPIRRIYFRNAQAFVYMNYSEECCETSDPEFRRYFQYVRYTLDSDIPVIRVTQPDRKKQITISLYCPGENKQKPLTQTCAQDEVQKRVKELIYIIAKNHRDYERELYQQSAQTSPAPTLLRKVPAEAKKSLLEQFVDAIVAAFKSIFSSAFSKKETHLVSVAAQGMFKKKGSIKPTPVVSNIANKDKYIDPITFEIMKDPMFVPCAVTGSSVPGRYYDRSTIEQMKKTGRTTDPIDNTSPLGNAKAAPLEFKREIKAYV